METHINQNNNDNNVDSGRCGVELPTLLSHGVMMKGKITMDVIIYFDATLVQFHTLISYLGFTWRCRRLGKGDEIVS